MVGGLVVASAFTFSWGAHAATGACTPDPANIGTACASGDATTQTGYVVVDGSDTGPIASHGGPSGYIGVDNTGVVGCWNGDYTPGGTTNNVISPVPPTVPSGPPSAGGPCSPPTP